MNTPKPDGGPAFPASNETSSLGISMRDYFAGMALQGMAVLAVYKREAKSVEEAMDVHEHLAESAYAMADAMLAKRSRNHEC